MKLSHPPIAILLAAICCAQLAPTAARAGAETWRCGNTYTDQPCHAGKPIRLDDARDASQKREADDATRDARTAADRMERERVRLESVQAGRSATLIDNKPLNARADSTQAPGVAQKKRKGKKDPAYFSAHDPAAPAKKKAAKAARS